MVTESMSYEEIASQMASDYPGACAKADTYFGRRKDYHRFIIKNLGPTQQYTFKPQSYLSRNHNSFITVYYTPGKNDYKKSGGLNSITFMTYLRKEGLYAVSTTREGKGYMFHTPHFFSRFRERGLKDESLSITDVMVRYFSQLAHFYNIPLDNPKYRNSTFVVSNIGVFMAEKYSESIIIMKTFLSFEMLKNQQIEDKDLCLELVNRLNQYLSCLDNPELVMDKANKANNVDYYGEPIKVEGFNDHTIEFSKAIASSHRDQIERCQQDQLMGIIQQKKGEIDKTLMQKNSGIKQSYYPIELISNSGAHYVFIPSTLASSKHLRIADLQYYSISGQLFFLVRDDQNPLKHNIFSEKLILQYQRYHEKLQNQPFEIVVFNFFLRLEIIRPLQYLPDHTFVSDINFGKIYGKPLDEYNNVYDAYSK